MTDLLKRLREDGRNGHNPLCLKAADSIEALETALREVLADDEALMDITWRNRAYAALGDKQ